MYFYYSFLMQYSCKIYLIFNKIINGPLASEMIAASDGLSVAYYITMGITYSKEHFSRT